jgi:hypothetical protein
MATTMTAGKPQKSAEAFIAQKERQFERDLAEKRLLEFPDIGREGKQLWLRVGWAVMAQSNYPDKVLVIEQLQRYSSQGKLAARAKRRVGEIQYRMSYFVIAKTGQRAGKWTFSGPGSAPMIPEADLGPLLKLARRDRRGQ